METFERITPERVEAAYQESGLKPIQGITYGTDDDVECGCALGAILIAEGVVARGVGLEVREEN